MFNFFHLLSGILVEDLIFIDISAAEYIVTHNPTAWDDVNCTLIQPGLVKSAEGLQISLEMALPSLTESQQYWIGYISAHMCFQYIGNVCVCLWCLFV